MNTLFDSVTEYFPSPFNYTGGKYKLLPQLEKYIPKDVETLYDIFCGGGSFFVNFAHKFKRVYVNDII